ncbi:glycosyltransferase family 39 protein [Saccharopolyspora sp. SCSIO 74807]|uniref:ArnT family glycosyltransferase n=1 Tax=Saccharopolyspora sp. SCSIO 74807 TaxID=3118084 RepID=UPI0030CF6219
MTTTAVLGAPTAGAADAAHRSRWQPAALAAICLLAGALYAWGIGDSWGNSYYSAAVKSMSQSFENFFFGSFDPVGVVTVDKPPMALWVQVISVLLLGYNKVAMLLPQVLAGVAAVFLLHRTVRRWAGEHAALLAALVMALTPITVAINQDNNPDTLLVLLVVAAAYALTRALSAERASRASWWLAASAALIGCGFLTKMLQAWMVLPVFIAVYLVGRETSWTRRIADLAIAAATVLVSSFWWVAATMLWPDPKPYIGGSEDGSALDLILGYNGFGRILGGEGNGGGGGGPGGGPGGGFSGEAGILRFANEKLAGQISWLMPLCALVLIAVVVGAVLRRRAGEPFDRKRAAGWLLWGGWLVLIWFMFSFAQGTMHPYYTTMLAPAIGAVAGAGIVAAWRAYRAPQGKTWLLLPVGVLLTVVWAVVLVHRDPEWNVWAAYLAIGFGVLALAALLLGRSRAALGKVALTLSLAAALVVPSVWSVAAAASGESGMGGANPMAGPSSGMGPGGGGPPGMSGPGQADPGQSGSGQPGSGQPGSGRQGQDGKQGGGDGPGRRGGMSGGPGGEESLSAEQKSLLAYVSGNAGDREVPLAVEGGSHGAASYLINSELPAVGMGGFMGSDDAPSVQQLTEWKSTGQLGFVQLGGGPGGGPGGPGGSGKQGPPGQGGHSQGGHSQGASDQNGPGAQRSQGPGGEKRTERQQWVQQNCTEVPPATYGATTESDEMGSNSTQLYDCRS